MAVCSEMEDQELFKLLEDIKTIEDEEMEEERMKTLIRLLSLFPKMDPEFLYLKIIELNNKKEELDSWIETEQQNQVQDIPTHDVLEQLRSDEKVEVVVNVTTPIANSHQPLVECLCCYGEGNTMDEMVPCKNGHYFCTECVQRASRVAIGDGNTSLQCLGQCQDNFDLRTLRKVLDPDIFSTWLKKIQFAEVREAGLDGLENCPFCDFATVMDDSVELVKVFECQNPDCGLNSCRLCKEKAHGALKCDEVEKDSEVGKRTYIENKMSEALIRKCWKCQKPYLKQDGCNKIDCLCGAHMCYLCREPVRGYDHFYGIGGEKTAIRVCPLFSDDQAIHRNDVVQGAQAAKEEMEQKHPEIELKFDPTEDI